VDVGGGAGGGERGKSLRDDRLDRVEAGVV